MLLNKAVLPVCFLTLLCFACANLFHSGNKRNNSSLKKYSVYTCKNDISDPAWSPDGSCIAFVSRNKAYRFYKISASGNKREKVMQVNSDIDLHNCTFSPDGQYLLGTNLSFDANTIQYNTFLYSSTQSSPLLLNEYFPDLGHLFKWSNDSRVIYCHMFDENTYTHLINAITVKGAPVFSVKLDSTAKVDNYSVAPDMQSIAWEGLQHKAKFWQIWLYSPAAGQRMLIAADSIDCLKPNWSPDGNRIAYHSYNHTTHKSALGIYSLADQTSHVLVSIPDSLTKIIWAEDGQAIYFYSNIPKSYYDAIYKLSLPSTSIKLLYKEASMFIEQFNSDGSYYPGYNKVNEYNLCIFSVPDKKVTTLIQGSLYDLEHPTWSPDGERLVYTCDNKLHVITVAGGTPASLNIGIPYKQLNPSFSPDGSLIAFDNGQTIYTVSPNGEKLNEISSSYQLQQPVWSPTGKQIACVSRINYTDSLMIFDYMDGKITGTRVWPDISNCFAWSKPNPLTDGYILFNQRKPLKRRYELKAMNLETGNMCTLFGEQGILFTENINNIDACWSPDGKSIAWTQLNYYSPGGYSLNIAPVYRYLK